MRQLIKIIFIFTISVSVIISADAAINGGVEYKIPIDYSVMNKTELETKADFYFQRAIGDNSGKLNENITQGLILYTILSSKCPEDTEYIIRLGRLYDNIGKGRYAKGCYYKAIGINKKNPDSYFYLGEYYFKREQYRHALKMYLKSAELGNSNDLRTMERLDTLRKMLGNG